MVTALPAGWQADRHRRDTMLRAGAAVGAVAGAVLCWALVRASMRLLLAMPLAPCCMDPLRLCSSKTRFLSAPTCPALPLPLPHPSLRRQAARPSVWALAAAMTLLGCYRGVYSAALEAIFADSVAAGKRWAGWGAAGILVAAVGWQPAPRLLCKPALPLPAPFPPCSSLYTRKYVITVGASSFGPWLSLLLFHFLGNRWEPAACRAVLLCGTAVMVVPLALMCLFDDDRAAQYHALPTQDARATGRQHGPQPAVSADGCSDTAGSRACSECSAVSADLPIANTAAAGLGCNGSQAAATMGGDLASLHGSGGDAAAEEAQLAGEEGAGQERRGGLPAGLVVTLLISCSDLIGALASGMTLRFFSLFFIQVCVQSVCAGGAVEVVGGAVRRQMRGNPEGRHAARPARGPRLAVPVSRPAPLLALLLRAAVHTLPLSSNVVTLPPPLPPAQVVEMGPMAVSLIGALSPLGVGAASLACQPLSKLAGRVQIRRVAFPPGPAAPCCARCGPSAPLRPALVRGNAGAGGAAAVRCPPTDAPPP